MKTREPTTESDRAECTVVREALLLLERAELDERSSEHLAECDTCRDFAFELDEARALARDAAKDYVHPEGFIGRLLSRLEEPSAASAPFPASVTPDPAVPADVAATPSSSGEPLPTKNVRRTKPASGAAAPGDGAGGRLPWAALTQLQIRWLSLAALAVALVAVWLAPVQRGIHAPGIDVGARLDAANAPNWSGVVERMTSSDNAAHGLSFCSAPGRACRELKTGDRFDSEGVLELSSGSLSLLRLDDGTVLTLDGNTQVQLLGQCTARLLRGRLVADVGEPRDAPVRVELPMGYVEVLGTKFSVQVDGDMSRVNVSRGEVKLADTAGRAVSVGVGQSGTLSPGSAPRLDHVASLASAFSWSERALERREQSASDEPLPPPRGLGQLRAKKPGETTERVGAVTLTRQDVKIRIVESMARTEVEQEFTNHTDEVLEGIYRFPLPPTAKIERLALWVDDHWEEGAFVERDRAAAIWRGAIVNSSQTKKPPKDDIVWVPGPWKDPALLEWQRGGSFELRVFPIPKRGARRIRLAYTQWLPPAGHLRRYVYPLPYDGEGSVNVDDFSIDLSVRGHQGRVIRSGYELQAVSADAHDRAESRFGFERRNFSPAGDLAVDFELPHEELRAWGYDTGGERMLAMALRPEFPSQSTVVDQAVVVVVDRSRSMFGESYERARQLAARFASELDASFELTVLACDTSCDASSNEPAPLSDSNLRRIEDFLRAQRPEGASDLVAALEQAARHLSRSSKPHRRIVYIGDGAPTAGPISAGWVAKELRRRWPVPVAVTAVSLGSSADDTVLDAVAGVGGGTVLHYWPGQTLGEVSYDLLSAITAPVLSDVELELPPGVTHVAPARFGIISAGAERLIVGKMSDATVRGPVVLRGRFDGRHFERRYDLRVEATRRPGNAFVPRLYAAEKIAELERETTEQAMREAIALSERYSVASRHTSLLVLESPAMFRAFGLDNQRHAPVWSGEEESLSSSSLAFRDSTDTLNDDNEGWAGSGRGVGSSGSGARLRRKATAPAPRSAPVDEAAQIGDEAKREERAARRCPPNDLMCVLGAEREQRFSPPAPAPSPDWRRPMLPMRRVWETTARIGAARGPSPGDQVTSWRGSLQDLPERRSALAALYVAAMRAGELEQAARLAERWSERDPLDPDALTARADVAAQRGDREQAIRILGSVLDVRPGDHRAAWRLARLHRWAGQTEQSCAFALAAALLQSGDASRVGDAVRCARDLGRHDLADELMLTVPVEQRSAFEQQRAPGNELSGEFRAWATWEGAQHDLDVVFIHPDGYRVSWLGAPTRAVISASDVRSLGRDGLALRGAKTGRYSVEVVRSSGDSAPVRGTLDVQFRDQRRQFPFVLEGTRVRVANVEVSARQRLVPLR